MFAFHKKIRLYYCYHEFPTHNCRYRGKNDAFSQHHFDQISLCFLSNHYTGAAIRQLERCTIERDDTYSLINALKEEDKRVHKRGVTRDNQLIAERDFAWVKHDFASMPLNQVMQSYT